MSNTIIAMQKHVRERNINIIKAHTYVHRTVSLEEIYLKIKGAAYQGVIEEIRQLIKEGESDKANNRKRELAAFTASGTFKGKRNDANLISYSQYMVLDIDKLEMEQVDRLKDLAQKIPYSILTFKSPSGNGLKIVVGVNSSKEEHKEMYKQVISVYKQHLNVAFDEKTKDLSRLCYLSHDPEAYFNPNADVFLFEKNNRSTFESQILIPDDKGASLLDVAFKNALAFTSNIAEFEDGSRNNFIFQLACNCNRTGIDVAYVKQAALNKFRDRFDEKEIRAIIDSVYKKYKDDFGKNAYRQLSTYKNSDVQEKKEIEENIESLPCIPDSVVAKLPDFIGVIASQRESKRERDVIIVTTLILLSGSLHNTVGTYDGLPIYPNLFSFVIAPAASGKGVIKVARKLFDRTAEGLEADSLLELKKYYKEFPERKELEDDKDKPPLIQLYIPGNSSTSAIYTHLKQTDGVGVICESEADALGTILKNDWGNFSYILRATFHHETISNSRSGNKKVIVSSPKMAVALAGTPSQVSTIINSVEDGLFSRFIYYYFSDRSWRNTFEKKQKQSFNRLIQFASFNVANIISHLSASKTVVELSPEHGKHLMNHFRQKYHELTEFYSSEVDSTIKRMPLIVFRICMILTAVRKGEEYSNETTVVCSESDFKVALDLGDVFLQHSLAVFNILPKSTKTTFGNSQMLKFYQCLPENATFSRREAIEMAVKNSISISEKTVYNYLENLIGKGLIKKLGHSKYNKVEKA